MTNKFNIGDKVKTLVEKIENDNVFGKQICSKGSFGYVCDVGKDYVMVEATNQNDETEVFAFANKEVELVEESKIQ